MFLWAFAPHRKELNHYSDIDDSDGIIIVYDSLITASLPLLIKEIGEGQEGIRRTDHKFDVN